MTWAGKREPFDGGIYMEGKGSTRNDNEWVW